MTDPRLARRFAKALLAAAVARGVQDAVRADVRALGALIAESEEFKVFLTRACSGCGKVRQAALQEMFGSSFAPMTLDFLGVLESRKSLALLPAICEVFERLYRRQSGQTAVRVVSARALDAEEQGRFRETIAARFGAGAEATFATDPGLIAGFFLQAEEQCMDFSVAGRLARLRRGAGATAT